MEHVAVIGGGAAGFFAAITAAETAPGTRVTIFERGPVPLSKVRISGGGRCNVTHRYFEPREFVTRYPRGERALIGPLQKFGQADTVEWFESRGVKLKVEEDGRMFPVTDSSQTVIDCLCGAARKAGVQLAANAEVQKVSKVERGFVLTSRGKETLVDRIVFATGGCRTPAAGSLAVGLGHTLISPVPSLFSVHINCEWLRGLSGISLAEVEAAVPDLKLKERGAVLITHNGLSGPAILRLSAWGARELHEVGYQFLLTINWLPARGREELLRELMERSAGKTVANWPLAPIPQRLWAELVVAAGISPNTRWAELGRVGAVKLADQLQAARFQVTGKSLNKDEFVTCGGVKLSEINLKTMESKIAPRAYFVGELLDIDGITGGFNFQAAWTTGWLCGTAIGNEINGNATTT